MHGGCDGFVTVIVQLWATADQAVQGSVKAIANLSRDKTIEAAAQNALAPAGWQGMDTEVQLHDADRSQPDRLASLPVEPCDDHGIGIVTHELRDDVGTRDQQSAKFQGWSMCPRISKVSS